MRPGPPHPSKTKVPATQKQPPGIGIQQASTLYPAHCELGWMGRVWDRLNRSLAKTSIAKHCTLGNNVLPSFAHFEKQGSFYGGRSHCGRCCVLSGHPRCPAGDFPCSLGLVEYCGPLKTTGKDGVHTGRVWCTDVIHMGELRFVFLEIEKSLENISETPTTCPPATNCTEKLISPNSRMCSSSGKPPIHSSSRCLQGGQQIILVR